MKPSTTATGATSARFAGLAGIALAAALACSGASAQSLSLVPSANPVAPGNAVSLSVMVSGVADLYAWQFSLGFDPAVLQATGNAAGSFLSGGGSTIFIPGTIDNTLGRVSFATETLVGAVPGVSGGGMLLSIGFNALAVGTSALTIDAADTLLLNSALDAIQAQLQSSSVSVVPEPSAALLLALGIAALALRRRSPR